MGPNKIVVFVKRVKYSLSALSIIVYDILLTLFTTTYLGFVEINPIVLAIGFGPSLITNLLIGVLGVVVEYFWKNEINAIIWHIYLGVALGRFIQVTTFFVASLYLTYFGLG